MAKSALSIISFILNIVYIASGVILALASVYYYLDMQQIKQIRTSDLYVISPGLKWPDIVPYIFFAVGVLVSIVALCGFGGAYSKTILIVYGTFLLITVGVSTAAASVVYQYADSNRTDEYIGKIIESGIEEVSGAEIEAGATTAFGKLEEAYRCCGDINPDIYLTLTRSHLYPKTCCNSDAPCSGRMGNAKTAQHRHGCRKVVVYKTRRFIFYLWIGCASVAVIGLVNLFVVALVFMITVRKRQKPNFNETQTLKVNGASVNSVSI